MKTGIFCIWCGSEVEYKDDHTVCLGCGAIFTDLSFSRTPSYTEEDIADEIDVSIESICFRPKFEGSAVFQTPPKVEYIGIKR